MNVTTPPHLNSNIAKECIRLNRRLYDGRQRIETYSLIMECKNLEQLNALFVCMTELDIKRSASNA